MNQKVIEGAIKDWGELIFSAPVKGKKANNIRGGRFKSSSAKPKPSTQSTFEKIVRTVNKSPEVMMKISGGGKNMGQIKAHMDYISRDGALELEDENGLLYLGKDDVNLVRDAWAEGRIGIPETGEKRKEAFNIVLSMPPGTNRELIKNAARHFAKGLFKDHQYVFVAHNDEKHPHVHLAVKAADKYGLRLNPRKDDLQQWREYFAEKLREQGLEANATPRRARGVVKKAEKQSIQFINRDFQLGKRKMPARVSIEQFKAAQKELNSGTTHVNPAKENIKTARQQVQTAYGHIARALAGGELEDKKIALNIMRFVQDMPELITKHHELMKDQHMQKNKKDKNRDIDVER